MSSKQHSEGRGSGVHWFVAWRYLLDDDRAAARSIVSVIALCLWVIAGFGVVALWLYPLSDPHIAMARPVPWWLTIALGLATTGIFFAPMVSGRAFRAMGLVTAFGYIGPRPGGVPTAVLAHADDDKPYSIVAAIGCGIAALCLLGVFWLLYRPFTETAVEPVPASLLVCGTVSALLLVVILPNALAWYTSIRVETKRDGGKRLSIARLFGAVLLFSAVINLLVTAGATFWGFRHIVWPAQEAVAYGKLLLFAGGAISLIGIAGLAASFVIGEANRSLVRWSAVRAIWIGLGLLVLLGFLHVRAVALASLPPGFVPLQSHRPSFLMLPILVAFATLVLSLVLLAIRYMFTFFSTVSVGGVAIGSMALVIVLSVMSGFENDLRRKILGSNAHVLITKANDKPLICRALPQLRWQRCVLDVEGAFTEYRAVGKKVEAIGDVVASSPYLISEVVIAANNNYANVIIKGVEPETVGAIGELDENIRTSEGEVDALALARLWPLSEAGEILGRPEESERRRGNDDVDGDGFSDAIPDDPEPTDFSGDSDDTDSGFSDDIPDDPTPIDFSGRGAAAKPDAAAAKPDASVAAGPSADKLADAGPTGRAVPISGGLPPLTTPSGELIDLDPDDDFIRRIPPLVAILPGTLVGKELVKQINLYDGQEVKIVSPLGQDTPLGPVPRTKRFRVAATFFTGMYEYDLKFIYVEVGALQDFLDLGDEVTGIEIRVEDPSDTGDVVASLGEVLGPEYRIQDWKELNRSLFSALKLEKIAMFLVLAIIILVASFSIVGNLIMVVVEKAREIAVLKTLGTSDVGIMKIFITQGFFIGLVGTSLGVVLGLGACIAMQTFGLPLDPDVYYIDRLPIHIEPLSVALVFAAGVVISVVATLYPAYVAASMRPVNGLRYE